MRLLSLKYINTSKNNAAEKTVRTSVSVENITKSTTNDVLKSIVELLETRHDRYYGIMQPFEDCKSRCPLCDEMLNSNI